MKLFWKIYITVLIFCVVAAILTSYTVAVKLISYAEKRTVEENRAIGSFLSKEIEVGYSKLNWPFESLKKLSEYRSFLFWWVVRDDGTIHLANKIAFMGTYAYDYFPQVANRTEDEKVFLNSDQNYGILIKSLDAGGKKWSFWLGFSLKEVSEVRKNIIFLFLTGSMSALIVLGFIFYFTIKHFTKPINNLIIGTEIIGKGDLTHRVKVKSRDELGQLANSFNKMADALQETTVSKDYVDNIIRNMVDSLIVVHPDSKIRTVNNATCELLGYKEEELIGRPVEQIFAPVEEIPLKGSKLEKLINEGELRNYETKYKSKEGKEIPILFSSSVIKDREGNIICIVCAGKDITEQKQAQEALHESEEKFRSIIESSPDAITVTDLSGIIVECNQAAMDQYGGSTKAELIGKSSFDLIAPRDRQRAAESMEKVFKQGVARNIEYSLLSKDGHEYPVELSASVVRNSSGKPVFFVGITKDITERKQAEGELKKLAEKLTLSNTELEQFAYIASHDLQEPLRMVASYVQLLAKRYKGKLDTDADDFIAYAVDGANRMQRLINDLLEYSRVSTRGRDFKPTNCETILAQVLDNLQVAIEESDAIVTHDPLPTVIADDMQLIQLFQNLISNAIKFHGEETPRVHVSTEQKENEYVFSVRDNGIGIEPEYFDRIFVIFQRLHSKREYSGTGIGLTICKKIVERHGGRIWVESQPGKGATFYFTIPTRGGE